MYNKLSKTSEFYKIVEISDLIENYTLPKKSKINIKNIKNKKFREVDFNHPIFGGGIFNSKVKIINCSFEKIDLNGVNALNVHFKNCIFTDSILGNNSTTLFKNSKFEDCIFKNCSFKYGTFMNCSFLNVEFLECDFFKVSFIESFVKDVYLNGALNRLTLSNSSFDSFNFKDSSIQDSSIIKCTFLKTVFPRNKHCFIVKSETFINAKDLLVNILSESEFSIYSDLADILASVKGYEVVDERTFEALGSIKKTILENLYRSGLEEI